MRNKILFIFLFLGIVFAQKQNMSIKVADGSKYKNVNLVELNVDKLVFKFPIKPPIFRISFNPPIKYETINVQISDITQLQSIKDEKLSGWKVGLGLCGIGVGGIIGFLGLMSSTNNDINYNPAIGVPLIMVGSLAIYKSFTWAFYSKDKQTYDFNKIPAEKKKEILIRLIEHGELWSKSST